MEAFRRAARRSLAGGFAQVPSAPGALIDRASLDVVLDGSRELVSLVLRSEELSWSCTCRKEQCAHARAVLALLAGADSAQDGATQAGEGALVQTPAGGTERRTVMPSLPAATLDAAALCEALDDLITAVLRGGAVAGLSPSVEEALARLTQAAPAPLPLGLSRWGGRLKRALAEADVDELARLLHAAGQLVEDLQAPSPNAAARSRTLSWLGARSTDGEGATRFTDAPLLEIAREWVPALERAGIERRYLLDLRDGEIYCEERVPSAAAASLGPCPRQLTVWLSLVQDTAPPKRTRLLQYSVTPVVEHEAWAKVEAYALHDFTPLLERYRDALCSFAGLGEPVALLAPAAFEDEAAAPALTDARGHNLPLRGGPALLQHARRTLAGGELKWVAGRVMDDKGVLGVLPLSAAVMRHGRLCYARM